MKTWVFKYIDTSGGLCQYIVPNDGLIPAVLEFDNKFCDECAEVLCVMPIDCDEVIG